MKLLNGKEIADYIKERQAKDVRRLRQEYKLIPKLAIIVTVDNPAINTYVNLKKAYGSDILVEVEVHNVKQVEVKDLLNKLNNDDSVNGIIVQLPLDDPAETDELVNLVAPNKDVDGLGDNSKFEPATPMAVLWLLSGYNIELSGKQILLVGQGKLVGEPLRKTLTSSGFEPVVVDKSTKDLKTETLKADIIISATGVRGLLKSDMIKPGAVVIDAGVASEEAQTVGDVADEVYKERIDLTITPTKGGVGPLTVSALFENVIRAAQNSIKR